MALLFNDTVSINQRQYKINDRMINECQTAGGMNWQGKEKYSRENLHIKSPRTTHDFA
jgi:hypothetical protein